MNDMFNASGMYAYPNVMTKTFPNKKCAVEMILPDGSTAFSTICGIGGRGNASRELLKNPKRDFQLKFKGDFGDSSLNYQLYPDSPVTSSDDILLRPDFNSSWRHWSDGAQNSGNLQRTRATRIRDAFVKDTFRAMGQPVSHHCFFHLFLNGLYWGAQKLLATPTRGVANSAAATLGLATLLKINEWLAAPVFGGDWFEIYNPSANPVNMAGLFLTDDPSEIGRAKFTIPALSFVAASGWVKWEADNGPEPGGAHVNFTLDANAEYLRLSNNDANFTAIDTVSFGQQLTGVAQGRIADGGGVQLILAPTPGASITVLLAPTITSQPGNVTAAQGAGVQFNAWPAARRR